MVGVPNASTKTVAWVVAASHYLNFCLYQSSLWNQICFVFIWALCFTEQYFVFIKAFWETKQGHFYFEKPCASRSNFQNNWSSPSQFRLVGHRSPPVQDLTKDFKSAHHRSRLTRFFCCCCCSGCYCCSRCGCGGWRVGFGHIWAGVLHLYNHTLALWKGAKKRGKN